MKFCSKCGKELMDEAVVCPECGCPQGNTNTNTNNVTVVDQNSFGFGLLGFCIPIVGLILFLCWKDTTPLKAKSAGMGALISVIISVVVWIIYFVIIGAAIGSTAYYY